MGETKRRSLRIPGSTSILASLISIGVGLIVGLVLLYVLNARAAGGAFISLIITGFRSSDKFAKVLYQAAPLIMTGLSVGFAFKTGLFNIGATGQYTVGSAFALIGAIQFQLPWYVCLLLAFIGGAFWGVFPGLFKALFNVNEVITSIMFNWIAMFAVNLTINNLPMMLAKYWGGAQMDRTANLAQANPNALIPRLGLDVLMKSNYMNISIFIAVAFALVAWVILSKTTFGYELKACGCNRNASIYAGINAKRNIVLSMVIAGAFAGVGGGLYFLAGTGQYTLLKQLLAAGFNGIPVALLATSNPIGTIFSAFFVSYIQVGGDAMQPDFVKEIIDIIISVIIYLAAFALLTRELLARGKQRREDEAEAAAAAIAEAKDEIPSTDHPSVEKISVVEGKDEVSKS